MTTCMARVQECPVMIEHVDAIVEMRRGLVLNESRFPMNSRRHSRISSGTSRRGRSAMHRAVIGHREWMCR